MASHIGRRKFLATLGGAAAAWPLAARAQQGERMRRIGMLVNFASNFPDGQARVTTFVQAMQKLGWIDGVNVHIDIRWAADDAERHRQFSEELVGLAPDVIVAGASLSVAALKRVTRSVPIVFAGVIDPVGAGFVNSLARPGGNVTGFMTVEYSMSGKWLEVLKELAPNVTRVAVVRDPTFAAGIGQFAAIQSAASSTKLELSAIDQHDPGEMERALAAFAREPNGGMIITASASAVAYRELIISLASRYRLPNVYPFRYYPMAGGLASYGPDTLKDWLGAAAYVDRILKGEKPADLPVQAPTKYELVINLKTAKALGLEIPPSVLARADEVIE
jgi:putative tryptophan/tyrosine transport system substrate-binding protein